jgi:probable rRNA maturation factor
MIFVQFADSAPDGVNEIDSAVLVKAAEAALKQHGTAHTADKTAPDGSNIDLSIIVSNDQQLHELNLNFLDIDQPTDVLAFPSGETDVDTGRTYLGDVIISCQRAQAQADAAGHSYEDEMQLLVVHGVLHLLGHEHDEEQNRQWMWEVQARALRELGLPETVYNPTGLEESD